jgi:tetraacyldisaccharide 4'-kinase
MTRFSLAREFEALWQGRSPATLLLLPLSWLFGLAVKLRRWYWKSGPGRPRQLPVPVIVVGNITAGGTGKTPVVDWLANVCRTAGFVPGIVSRGYGGRARSVPHLVQPGDDPLEVGDEPLLLRRRTGVPVCICPDRVAAGERLLAEGVDLVIADDGLQHYRLARDMEIAVVDGERRFGNGLLLPAGPLREPPGRLAEVDAVLRNGGKDDGHGTVFHVRIDCAMALDGGERRSLESFRGQRVRALAGIGNPRRFYAQLAAAGMEVIPVPVADHRSVSLVELFEHADTPVFMTEKDAVKYQPLTGCAVWTVPMEIDMPAEFREFVLARLARLAGLSA